MVEFTHLVVHILFAEVLTILCVVLILEPVVYCFLVPKLPPSKQSEIMEFSKFIDLFKKKGFNSGCYPFFSKWHPLYLNTTTKWHFFYSITTIILANYYQPDLHEFSVHRAIFWRPRYYASDVRNTSHPSVLPV